ncbi:MAG TPA: metalloregulator ArsR/SmtB family transcription factor [Actinotalea sp.]|nr:metalloregulator ArsR/SmtB family transcription factor [Actinotalea sp.]
MAVSIAIESSRPAERLGAQSGPALLQAVADPVRWTVLDRLRDGTHCVCDLQAHVSVAPNLLSYHLKVLREAGLVTTSRRGRWVDYTLAPDAHERLAAALPGPARTEIAP